MATKKPTTKKAKKQQSTDKSADDSDSARKWATIAAVGMGVAIVVLLILFAMPADTFRKDDMSPLPTPEQDMAENTTWKLVTFLQNGQSLEIPEGAEVTLIIEGNQFGGVSGCNNYTGSYEITDEELGIIEVSPIASTRKMCIDEALMAFEGEYLTTLQDISSMSTFEDAGFTLYSGTQGKTALSYEKVTE